MQAQSNHSTDSFDPDTYKKSQAAITDQPTHKTRDGVEQFCQKL